MARSRSAVLLLMLAVWSGAAHAQRVIAVGTAFSATHEAARIYLHSADMQWGTPLPGLQSLRGVKAGPLLLSPNGKRVLISSGESFAEGEGDSPTWLAGFQCAPFAMKTETALSLPGGRAVCLAELPGKHELRVLVVAAEGRGTPSGHAAVQSIPWNPKKGGSFGEVERQWQLPGIPLSAKVLPSSAKVIVLYSRRESGPALTTLDLVSGEMGPEVLVTGERNEEADARPAGLGLTPDAQHVLVLLSGLGANEPGSEASSWLHVYDAKTLVPKAPPLEIAGAAHVEDEPIHPAGADRYWIASLLPGTSFGYATQVWLNNGVLQKTAEYALNGVSSGLELAVAPDGVAVAVGVGTRLELWHKGERGETALSYEEPIRVLRWSDEGLLAAEGARIHLLNPDSGESLRSVELIDGQVTDLLVAPKAALPQNDEDADGLPAEEEAHLGASPHSPDTDKDGLPDGTDPAPGTPTAWVETRPLVTFRGEAVGREVQCLPIEMHHGENVFWRIAYDSAEMPWLRMHPESGKGRGYVYMVVDPARYHNAPLPSGTVRVELAPPAPGVRVGPSPETTVRVTPGRPLPPKVLWVWPDEKAGGIRDENDPRHMKALADLLSAPPHFFAHHEVTGPVNESLEPYTVVVLGAEAAALGAVTRQAVLDYVKNGGALLFMGQYLQDEGSRALTEWLSPLSIRIDTGVRVSGRFAAAGDQRILRYWHGFEVKDGCAIGAEKGYTLERGGAKGVGAVMVAREYGLGRIALLAASTPLESAALKASDEVVFAGELFTWLARARVDFEDQDGDGLPDSVEDANGNGVWDSGETDYQNPDTDGDGLPDGVEDADRNGRVDDGETDPRNPDSDDDGILDGADSTPCPVFGSPILLSMVPEIPAEGGRIVVVTGENLTSDSVFWFDERRAPSARVVNGSQAWVMTPDFGEDEGGEIPVRVTTNQGKLEGMLPGGYRYTPRSKVNVELLPVISSETGAGRAGELLVRLEASESAMLNKLVLILKAEPSEGFVWGDVVAGNQAGGPGTKVYGKAAGGVLVVVLELGTQWSKRKGEVVRIAWASTTEGNSPAPVRIVPVVARATTSKDSRLVTAVQPVYLSAGGTSGEAPRKPQWRP